MIIYYASFYACIYLPVPAFRSNGICVPILIIYLLLFLAHFVYRSMHCARNTSGPLLKESHRRLNNEGKCSSLLEITDVSIPLFSLRISTLQEICFKCQRVFSMNLFNCYFASLSQVQGDLITRHSALRYPFSLKWDFVSFIVFSFPARSIHL